ncbi:MAG: hypothetical protein DRM99_03745 [Thermoplasmata archaeon]|nr:MAG: hypothetical protein DRM99_03745 [Thermoplasmata archaeon]
MTDKKNQEEFERLNEFFWTPQEHELSGSTLSEEDKNCLQKPYTPIAVQKEIITVKECNQKRQKVGKFKTMAKYKGKIGTATFTYELLDADSKSNTYGQTIKDPKPIEFEDLDGNKENLEEKLNPEDFFSPKISFKRN